MSHGKRTIFIWFRVGCRCPKTTCISAIKPPVFLFCGCLLVTLEFYFARTAAELSARMMRSMPSVDVETPLAGRRTSPHRGFSASLLYRKA